MSGADFDIGGLPIRGFRTNGEQRGGRVGVTARKDTQVVVG